MLKNIRISELQFHLRDEKCKVYPATVNELPFYLCLKHDDREIYDKYFNHTKRVCPDDFSGLNQHYVSFETTHLNIVNSGYDETSLISLWKNPKGNWGKLKADYKASDGNYYLVEDGMHRLSILFYLYGDVELVKVASRGRKHGAYKPLIEEKET